MLQQSPPSLSFCGVPILLVLALMSTAVHDLRVCAAFQKGLIALTVNWSADFHIADLGFL
jgi:hypothetical protein